ncbi:MAG: SBBP repeat-containing protein [Candidatus Sulfotelmatobacter sp.]
MRKNANGDLVVPVGEQKMLLKKPRIYQGTSCAHVDSSRVTHDSCREIAGGGYIIRQLGNSGTQISFELPRYDHSQPLVIDPVVAFSTFLGAGGGPEAMTLDSTGNIYMVGATGSTTLPVTSNAFQKNQAGEGDLFMMKLNNNGSQVIYLTYLGGSAAEFAGGIAIDSAGNAYVTGQTYSTDFPLSHPFQSQNSGASAFVSKLSPDGSSLIYSTYLGGSPAVSSGNGIVLDSSDEAIIVGYTYDTNFPTVNAFQPQHAADDGNTDAFLTKFAADGASLIFSTYLGGTEGDLAAGLASDPAGNIYVTGPTSSSDFPTTAGAYQATYVSGPFTNSFVSEFGPSGSIVYSTYLPAGQASAIAVNAAGNAFVTGSAAKEFPVTPGGFQTSEVGADTFVAEFNSTGSALVYATFLGGNDIDTASAIAVDSSNNAYVTGETSSLDFPLQLPVQTTAYGGVPNAFVSELNSTGTKLLFSTFLGGGAELGSGSQQGTAIAVDGAGNIYVGGGTEEPDFPVVNALHSTLNGFADGFLVKFVNEPAPSVGLSPASVSFSPVVVNSVSAPQTITVTNVGNAALTISAVTTSGSFSQTNNCGAGMAVNASCTIQATFAPSVFGANTGDISVASNATLFPEVVQLSGTGQDFIFGGTPGGATVSPGQQATVSLSLAPEGGFAQQISFSCTGTPPGARCSVSPSSVTLDGTDSATATMTITTTASGAAVPPAGPALPGALLALPVLGLLACLFRLKTISAPRVAFVSLVVLGSLLIACGGSGGGGTSTPGGTYNIVVTATSGASLSHGLEFALTVN